MITIPLWLYIIMCVALFVLAFVAGYGIWFIIQVARGFHW